MCDRGMWRWETTLEALVSFPKKHAIGNLHRRTSPKIMTYKETTVKNNTAPQPLIKLKEDKNLKDEF